MNHTLIADCQETDLVKIIIIRQASAVNYSNSTVESA